MRASFNIDSHESQDSPATPEVFAVVVNYNGAPWIRSCLDSLRGSDYPLRIIVVDNASQDGSAEIARAIDGVEVIQQTRNLGFGKANNIGIAHALRRGAEFVFLLNQDAKVESTALSELVSFLRLHPDAGVASPVHLNDTSTLLDRNFLLHYLAPQAPDFISDAYGGELAGAYRVSSVNAAAWLISRRCLEEVGGFDPLFFMYGEDDDYCARVAYHGLSCYVVTQARIRHARGFHQPEYRTGRVKRVIKSARFTRAQIVRTLKNPSDSRFLRAAYREVITLVLDGTIRSIATLSPSPLLPSLIASVMVCRDLPAIARHKRACQTRGPTWLNFRIDPGPTGQRALDPVLVPAVSIDPDVRAVPTVTPRVAIRNDARVPQAVAESLRRSPRSSAGQGAVRHRHARNALASLRGFVEHVKTTGLCLGSAVAGPVAFEMSRLRQRLVRAGARLARVVGNAPERTQVVNEPVLQSGSPVRMSTIAAVNARRYPAEQGSGRFHPRTTIRS